MKIQYFSDLHLEFLQTNCKISDFHHKIQKNASILILNGDIGNPRQSFYEQFIDHVSHRFDKIFLLSGNHEYYGDTIESTDNCIRSICQNYKNVNYLQNTFEDYHGFRFAGTTLWSHITNEKYVTNDFHHIQNFNISKYNDLHNEAKKFIQLMLQESPYPVIMLTHHLPSHEFVDKIYEKYKNYQQCYSSNLNDLIRYPIHSWIYGHTHKPYVGIFQGVHIYCNPIGYIGENEIVNYNQTFEIMNKEKN